MSSTSNEPRPSPDERPADGDSAVAGTSRSQRASTPRATSPSAAEKLATVDAAGRTSARDRIREPWITWAGVRSAWPWFGAALILLVVGWMFIKPAPPKTVVLAAGPNDGAYQWFAKQYAKTFADSGITLEVRETAGSVANYQLLDAAALDAASAPHLSHDDKVSVAMVQSGTCPEGIHSNVKAIASLYLEPVWIFHRVAPGDESKNPPQIEDFRGRRIAVGPDGSGTRSIAERLLNANRIPWNTVTGQAASQPSPATQPATRPATSSASRPGDPVLLSPQSGRAAAAALREGRVDAALFVLSPRHPMTAELLADPSLRLMSFDRHEAYARVFPFLKDVKLPRGAIDLARDLPREDVHLLAPAANLVCREGTHPAIVALLIRAAHAAHERGDLLSPPGALPSTQYVEFPIDAAAADYFKHGPPFLQRVLPFTVAAFVDRMKILLLPLLTLIIPLARVAPPLYVWRIRSRIYRWYKLLHHIDERFRGDPSTDPAAWADDLATLADLERELIATEVPLSYMQEAYHLRLHIDYLRRRIEERVGEHADGK